MLGEGQRSRGRGYKAEKGRGSSRWINPSPFPRREPAKEQVREETVFDTRSSVQQHTEHTVRDLPPFTNVSLRLILSNPEGRKESEELLVLTDEDGTTPQTHAHPR